MSSLISSREDGSILLLRDFDWDLFLSFIFCEEFVNPAKCAFLVELIWMRFKESSMSACDSLSKLAASIGFSALLF